MAAQPLIRRAGALALVIAAIAGALPGCTGPHPFIREGDSKSVEINYAGDVATTLPLATQYCARYERKPVLADAGLDIAYYNCVNR